MVDQIIENGVPFYFKEGKQFLPIYYHGTNSECVKLYEKAHGPLIFHKASGDISIAIEKARSLAEELGRLTPPKNSGEPAILVINTKEAIDDFLVDESADEPTEISFRKLPAGSYTTISGPYDKFTKENVEDVVEKVDREILGEKVISTVTAFEGKDINFVEYLSSLAKPRKEISWCEKIVNFFINIYKQYWPHYIKNENLSSR